PFPVYQHLYSVRLDGSGVPEPFRVGPARAISFAQRGGGVVVGRNTRDPARWKRYRGGTAGTIWVDRRGGGEFEELLRLEGNLAHPMWVRDRIYFVSDHEGTGNLYSVTPTGRNLTRHTEHRDFYARSPQTDSRRIVYHAGADLYLFDPRTGEGGKIDVRVPSARPQRNRKFLTPGRYLESVALHPLGHSAAMVVRGGAYTMPLWEGAVARHGSVSRHRYRLVGWLPDGDRVVAVTDQDGEEGLVVFPVGGSGEAVRVPVAIGRPDRLAVAPASDAGNRAGKEGGAAGARWRGGRDRVAISNQRQDVMVVDLGAGRAKLVYHSPHERIQGLAWSADGRWLAFAAFATPRACVIHLHDTRTGRARPITRPDFVDVRPAFDPEGRYLYFISYRVFDPVYDGHFHDYAFPKGGRPCLVTLAADQPSPFDQAMREPRPPGSPAGGNVGKDADQQEKDQEAPPQVEVDLEGIEDRVVALPVSEARYRRVLGAKGRIIFSSFPVEGTLDQDWTDPDPKPKGRLEAYDFAQEKVEQLTEGISDFTVSADGKVMG
ncbi:MAG: S41 family peptidase, partial [Acidimicrobiia bacterium]